MTVTARQTNLARNNSMDQSFYRKLSPWTKHGYGIGTAGDTLAYSWTSCFLIFFLTDFAGLNPAFAGFIIMLSVIWDGITDPVIGSLSDKCKSKYGRRRPFIIGAIGPLALALVLMFTVVPFKGMAANIYYLLVTMIFWTAYTSFNIPYYSLGVSLSYDEDERTSVRAYSTAYSYAGGIGATFLPTMLIGVFKSYGCKAGTAWTITAAVLAMSTFLLLFITWRSTRGKEIMIDASQEDDHFSFKQLLLALKPRSIRIIFVISFLFYLFYTISSSSTMYFAAANLRAGESEASYIYLTNSLVGIVVVIVLSRLSLKFDKKYLFLGCAIFGALAQIAAKFIGIKSLAGACVLEVFRTIGNGSFWLFTFAFIYDATEVEEFRSGKRREGVLVAYQSFIMKLGAAAGVLIVGMMLKYSGYVGRLYEEPPNAGTLDPVDIAHEMTHVQGAKALDTIESLFTVYPGVIILISALFIWLLPITRKKYALLVKNLELKRAGKQCDVEGFEDLF